MASYSYKKNHPVRNFIIVVIVIALIASLFAILWRLSDGFSDWSWFSDDDEDERIEDEESVSAEISADSVTFSENGNYGFSLSV